MHSKIVNNDRCGSYPILTLDNGWGPNNNNYFILSSEINVYEKWIKGDIFTAELILIFSLVIDISQYFHCRVWITSDVSIHLTSLNLPHFRNSNAYNSVIYERKHKVWVFIFLEC